MRCKYTKRTTGASSCALVHCTHTHKGLQSAAHVHVHRTAFWLLSPVDRTAWRGGLHQAATWAALCRKVNRGTAREVAGEGEFPPESWREDKHR